MATKSPPRRRKFQNEGDEIDYLYERLLFWLYDRGDAASSTKFCVRLQRLLNAADSDQGSIFGQECRSLIAEANGDLARAIRHRQREIAKIKRLHEISKGTPSWDFVTQNYAAGDLSDRFDLLAILQHDRGDLDAAINTLRESKQLCNANRIPFDGDDLLRDCLKEQAQQIRPVTQRAGLHRRGQRANTPQSFRKTGTPK